jgi:HAD superfamily hydrolase (TIGR01509 family)
MIRLVLFDWGGVLTVGEFDRQICRELAGRHDLPEEDVYQSWRKGRRLACERGEAPLEEAWEELAARFGLRAGLESFTALLLSAVVPNVPMIDLLPVLRSRVALGLLSNNYPFVANLVRRSLASYFDRLHFSNETCRVKPDPHAYREALDAAGVRAGDTLFVDDKERNLVPARALGMAVHRYESPTGLRAELVDRGVLVA